MLFDLTHHSISLREGVRVDGARSGTQPRALHAAGHQHIPHRERPQSYPGGHRSEPPSPTLLTPLTVACRVHCPAGEAETAEEYVSQLFDFVFPACSAAGLTDIVLTHGHADHQGGAGRILEECRRRGLPLPRVHKHRPPGDRFPVTGGIPCEDIQDGQTFCTEVNRAPAMPVSTIPPLARTDLSLRWAVREPLCACCSPQDTAATTPH